MEYNTIENGDGWVEYMQKNMELSNLLILISVLLSQFKNLGYEIDLNSPKWLDVFYSISREELEQVSFSSKLCRD